MRSRRKNETAKGLPTDEPVEPGVWIPKELPSGRPAYLAIADAIASDVRSGRLGIDDRLPPQRHLAQALGLNFSTISRAYDEAQRRGLIDARVGRGTFVRVGSHVSPLTRPSERAAVDLSMNLPPEPDNPELLRRMESALPRVGADLAAHLRYQPFGGGVADRDAGAAWLARRGLPAAPERTLVCPGTHSALDALFCLLVPAGKQLLCDEVTYAGTRAIAATRGIGLVGIGCDREGMLPDFLEESCRRDKPGAIYCNPTIQNPTTATQSLKRRTAIAEIARRYNLPIVEDDVYGLLPEQPPPAYAQIAPERTYYVGGLSKTLGAGLRLAFVLVPDLRGVGRLSAQMRATNVMASPVTMALANDWIQSGTADAIVAFVRSESRARQAIARHNLPADSYSASPDGFHLWLRLPPGYNRVTFSAGLRESGVGIVTSDAFTVAGVPPEAVRICLGGPASRTELGRAFEVISAALSQPPGMGSSVV
jgi:DNA-binding transcriptional MocR family regulator